jgi:ferredoxin-NADP reductase/nitrite reductase/ring-hydroxylating ferredoxin subunit
VTTSVEWAGTWHPIAAASDLPFRQVFQGQVLGRELAVWRADDGYVNVWENRCLHRGVRLSLGINDGRELKCQYHGWRYSNRTAGCTYIPAHPADAPARTITNRTFPAQEKYGLVWSSLAPEAPMPEVAELADGDDLLVLRGMAINAPAEKILALLRHYRFQPSDAIDGGHATVRLTAESDLSLTLRASENGLETSAVFFVQPVDSSRSVIRGVLDRGAEGRKRIAILRHHNERLAAVRDRAECEAAAEPAPPPTEPRYERVSPELAEMPTPSTGGRKAALAVAVARKWEAADGIAGFELRPIQGLLPTFQPGAHIDVHLPNGMIRQYSIVNGPGESDRYVIGVKRETDSRGGSTCMHETVRKGDVLAISEPRNNFPLRRDAVRTILIAGGIGITPLLAMAQALHHSRLPQELHYFVQNDRQLAFSDRLDTLGDTLSVHLGAGPDGTVHTIRRLLSGYRPGMHVYLCGPAPMLEASRAIAAESGWPDAAIHFEYFKNTHAIDDSSSFEIALARSLVTLRVPAGRTILQVLRENGIDIPSSCEQGACGTCVATVIEGEPLHQDVYLHEEERKSGHRIMTCVSRAKSARLVLDI